MFNRLWLYGMAGMLAALLGACGPSSSLLSKQNDELRKQNLDLERQVTGLQEAMRRREAEVRSLEAKAQVAPAIEGADVPRLAEIRFGRYTNAVDTSKDGRDDALRLYLLTQDQQGHFLPVAAKLAVQAAVLIPGQEPRVVVDAAIAPEQFHAAYRSGITGTHYTFDLPLPKDGLEGATSLAVKAVLTDAATGGTFETQIALPLRPQAAK
ncbi:MAG: hypothetical protein IT440_04995 [Phycisphaeraceae bacterium]|nr:hypothetical protein [Phycisphaeraceae bacterium]